jgi:hypothetical protein
VIPYPGGEQFALFVRREQSGSEPRRIHRGPETVSGSGEVVACRRRVKSGIDAAEEHTQLRPDHVRHNLIDGGEQFVF